jgi:aliphatic sulfonates family ABC transporter substrate-binding protein
LASPAVAGGQVKSIRIGTTGPGHLKFLVNQARHTWDREFARDGIKVEYFPFAGGGAEAATALASGALDIAYTASDPALRIAAAGADVKFVALSGSGRAGSSSIIVLAGSSIKSLKDLKGKKVGYPAGTVRHASLAKALQSAGLGLGDIQSLNLAFRVSGPALLRGDIDAIVEGETTVATLLEKGAVRVVLDGRAHPEWATPSVISVNGAFARNHPDLVRRVLKIDLDCSAWADAHFDEAIQIQSAALGAPVRLLLRNYPERRFYGEPRITPESVKALQSEEQFMKKIGLGGGSIDYSSWVDRRYIDAVYAEAARK